ncbi:molecular chaperone HtpG [Comamonadaceae bacterium OH2545_COT-014]|nr:molecular chaperone HtpG [Comamonadaceae bacterium OH2545_COT-014]
MSTQKHAFQAEVAQLLHLVTHSLYSNPEIFLRELISNASDACDKLRFEALADPSLYGEQPALEVRISFDKTARTLTVTDTGIGMSEAEAVQHLGTIAKSGTRDFMARLSGDQKADAQLIGQFGVGFYSGFIVAERITVESRRAGLPPEAGVRWQSSGAGDFTVEPITRAERGTSVTLHLREDALGFADGWRLKELIGKYSDHIALPIKMEGEQWQDSPEEGQPGQMVKTGEWETVNQATALWTRPRKDITEAQYQDFYKQLAHDWDNPLTWSHNRVEGSTEYTQLLYIPQHATHDLWDREHKAGIKLYVRRVFIMDDAEQLMPRYLRFVKGVVDSADLPLNVSRELLQESRDVKAIRDGNTRRVLTMLEELAKADAAAPIPAADGPQDGPAPGGKVDIGTGDATPAPEPTERPADGATDVVDKNDAPTAAGTAARFAEAQAQTPDAGRYARFWRAFGAVLKEGLGEDHAHRERLLKLLRYASTASEGGASVSLADYKARMKPGQKAIYYLTAETPAAARSSPQLEVFRQKGIEVLLMTDRVDEWAMNFVHEFDGTPMQSVARGAVDLGELQDEAEKKAAEAASAAAAPLLARLKEALKDKAADVRATTRLVDSPACLVTEGGGMSLQLARMLRQAGQQAPEVRPVLEINPAHPLVKRLEGGEHFEALAHILFDQALLAEGGLPEDPAAYVQGVNALLA